MKTLKITSYRNGMVSSVKEVPISDEAFKRFSQKIEKMREAKNELHEKLRKRITPDLIEKFKQMNKNKSPG